MLNCNFSRYGLIPDSCIDGSDRKIRKGIVLSLTAWIGTRLTFGLKRLLLVLSTPLFLRNAFGLRHVCGQIETSRPARLGPEIVIVELHDWLDLGVSRRGSDFRGKAAGFLQIDSGGQKLASIR